MTIQIIRRAAIALTLSLAFSSMACSEDSGSSKSDSKSDNGGGQIQQIEDNQKQKNEIYDM